MCAHVMHSLTVHVEMSVYILTYLLTYFHSWNWNQWFGSSPCHFLCKQTTYER